MTTLSMVIVAASMMLPMPRMAPEYPPTWRMLVKIAQCEQPGGGWKGIAWHQTKNYSFYGGMGMTQGNWDSFKRKGQPKYMHKATIKEQLWGAHRLAMWVKKEYGNPWLAWDCYTKGNLK